MTKDPTHEVELNFFYLHYHDAKKLAEWADNEQSKLRSLYARHAILSMVFASEALVNRVLADFYPPVAGFESIEKLSTRDKWYVAPLVCGKETPSGQTFDPSTEPFQSFSELIKIRNWLAHPKCGQFIDAAADGSTITVMKTGKEVPWVDTLKGGIWPHTQIPMNPFELTGDHARKAIEVLDNMVKNLQDFLSEAITEEWLWEIELQARDTGQRMRITVDSLWGGYTPE